MTTINIRIEEKTKNQANKTLEKLGLDMSGAVKLFLHQVIKEDGLPFTPSNRSAAEIRANWDREAADTLKNGKGFKNAKELHESLLSKKEYERFLK